METSRGTRAHLFHVARDIRFAAFCIFVHFGGADPLALHFHCVAGRQTGRAYGSMAGARHH